MRSNIKSAALLLALSFVAGCIVNIPEQEGARPGSADMVKPGKAVRIDAPATFSVSEGTPRDLSELMAFAVDAMNIPDPNVPLTYKATDDAPFTISSNQTITGASAGPGKLEISSSGLETITVEVEVIATKMLNLPQAIYLDVNQDSSLEDLFRGSIEQDERDLLKFTVEDAQIAKIEGDSIKGIARGETKLTATLLHLSQEIRVVVRKPMKEIVTSPPMLRLAGKSMQMAQQLQQGTFEILSFDEDDMMREVDPTQPICDSVTFEMDQDASWPVSDGPMIDEIDSAAPNQYSISFDTNKKGYGAVIVSCGRDGSNLLARMLVELVVDRQAAAGGAHSCATTPVNVDDRSLIKCWGSNEFNSLAVRQEPLIRGTQSNAALEPNFAVATIPWLVDAGSFKTCTIDVQGKIFCSGAKPPDTQVSFESITLPPLFLATDISVGADHACAVSKDGELYCWGDNTFGQLGQGDTMPKSAPVQVPPGSAARQWMRVSAGSQHTCALDVYGDAFCWGANGRGRLGDGTTERRLTPTAVAPINGAQPRFINITASDLFTCAVESSGAVYCWGGNTLGRLANGTQDVSAPQKISPGVLGRDHFALDIDASAGSVCALVRSVNGIIRPACWGENSKGQLGSKASISKAEPAFFDPPLTVPVLSLSMGDEHGCFFTQTQPTPMCWGAMQNQRLGNAKDGLELSFKSVNTPPLPTNIKGASFNSNHGCARYENPGALPEESNVYCWGLNQYKQASGVDDFTVDSTSAATRVKLASPSPEDKKLSTLFTGPTHSCGLDSKNSAFCWGGNWASQTGALNKENQERMAKVGLTAQYTKLSLGQAFTCGIVKGTNTISCWGSPNAGRLGNPTGESCPDAECSVTDEAGDDLEVSFSQIATAFATTCAMGTKSFELGIYCWGARVPKKDSVGSSNGAVKIWSAANTTAVDLQAGDAHFCALVEKAGNKQVFCWGDNSFGEVDVVGQPYVFAPKEIGVSGMSESLMLGSDHSCALISGTPKKLACWGRNNLGQLGSPQQLFSRAPSDLPYTVNDVLSQDALAVDKLFGGGNNTCVLVGTNVYCTGDNSYGQLGQTKPTSISFTPVPVQGFQP